MIRQQQNHSLWRGFNGSIVENKMFSLPALPPLLGPTWPYISLKTCWRKALENTNCSNTFALELTFLVECNKRRHVSTCIHWYLNDVYWNMAVNVLYIQKWDLKKVKVHVRSTLLKRLNSVHGCKLCCWINYFCLYIFKYITDICHLWEPCENAPQTTLPKVITRNCRETSVSTALLGAGVSDYPFENWVYHIHFDNPHAVHQKYRPLPLQPNNALNIRINTTSMFTFTK